MMRNEILSKLGLTPNAMQEAAYQAIAGTENHVVILSPTGSGKTLAYLLPTVELLNGQSDDLQAVVIVPGRELALQSGNVLKGMGSGLRSMAVYGGRPTMDEHRVLRSVVPQVVFGTPGRLNDHLDKGNLVADAVRLIIIDEFDKCLQMGFQEEMQSLLAKLPRSARRILVSATDAEEIPAFMETGSAAMGSAQQRAVSRVDFRIPEDQTPPRVTVCEVLSPDKDKLQTLKALLLSRGSDSSIVFLNYRQSVERVAEFLRAEGFTVSAFHGGLDQKAREEALYQFTNASANILVSTDLGSRGLDIPDVANIIHYHLPEGEDGYIHRVGRTARWDKQGQAFFILGPDEHIPDYVDADVAHYELPADLMERLAAGERIAVPQPRMATLYIGKGKKDKISKGDIVGFLCKKGGLTGKDLGRIDVFDHYAYVAVARSKARGALRQLQNEKIKGLRTVVEPIR